MTVTASRLKEAMRQRGWDQTELSRRVGATQGAISKILVGKTSNSRFLPKIATQLGVPLPWLQGVTDDLSAGDANRCLSSEEFEWVELLRALEPKERAAAVTLIRSLAHSVRSPGTHAPRQEFRGPARP